MKRFLALAAVLACAQALPTNMVMDADALAAMVNETASRSARGMGFASMGSGTRGGAGGAVWTVWDAFALRDAVQGNSPRIVRVRGTIDLGALFTASPGVIIDIGSFKTIEAGDRNAKITGGGFRIKRNQQVIITNLMIYNSLSYAPGERPNGNGGINNQLAREFTEIDAVLCEEATHVWIDHNEFSDDPWNANSIPNNRMRHDGLVDIKRASNWITVSSNIFRNHNKNCLVGHSDSNASQDNGRLKTTFAYNWFRGTIQRNPRVRFGEVHVLNNLYTDIRSYGIGVAAGASIYAERNTFINTRAWRHPDGVPKPIGNLLNVMNTFVNSNWDSVPNNVRWVPTNYYKYTPIGAPQVEAHVRKFAGPWPNY